MKRYFIFPPHLNSASALPGETGNPEIVSFHLYVAFWGTQRINKNNFCYISPIAPEAPMDEFLPNLAKRFHSVYVCMYVCM